MKYRLGLIGMLLFAAHAAVAAPGDAFKNLAQQLGLEKEETVVDPDKAFMVDAAAIEPSVVRVRFTIDDCCYLYRDKIGFSISAPNGAPADQMRLGRYQLPPGAVMQDEFFGRTEVYRRSVDVRLPLEAVAGAGEFVLNVSYQGCAEKGIKICYPPITRALPIRPAGITAPGTTALAPNAWWVILSAFAGGLLLTFTPCVLPMIPILSGVIVGAEGARATKWRAGLLSYIYVLGTALTYAVAGAVAGATGEQLQAYFQNPWAIGIFSAIVVLLALSMFGLYELRLPSALQTLLHRRSHDFHHKTKTGRLGELAGVFALGAISALIIGACVAPVLAFTLGTAIAARDPWLGAGIMFALAHGQGAILVAIGISEGLLLPRSGAWMQTVKHTFGVLLLAVAVYLLGFLPGVPVLFLWAALLVVTGVYLGATQRLNKDAAGWRYLSKGVGTLLLIWGALALIGGFAGSRDLRNPLALSSLRGQNAASDAARAASPFVTVTTVGELSQRLAQARAAGKPAILDYYATWCGDCVRMENSTFLDTRVRAAIAARFVALQVDVTDPNDPESKAVKQRFAVYGPPALLVFSATGQERRDLRVYGYRSADEFLRLLAAL